ncbi:hypothetical protein PCC8801_2725 [Rippkaea orientalis PCC 8801]|uniref:Uncharacterized protein n=1 Tax=Rippkaea orientalis (strain PCC 8801 / RF-1) TaxID=41431 RepID=B7K5J3_RIPO1|nr:hypothetical protein PCC8801_2725 [Rippkaea orientalis PCC 8801]
MTQDIADMTPEQCLKQIKIFLLTAAKNINYNTPLNAI